MTVAFGLWSLELTPGKVQLVIPPADIRITNVALGDTLVDASGRSTVKLTYNPFAGEDDEEDEEEDSDERTTVLCSLTAGKFEHTTTDIVLEKNGGFHFELVGKNSVYLSGNYIDQESIDNPPYGESDFGSEDEGDLDELASDVDMNSDDVTDASRFEELAEEGPQILKRGRESDHIDFKAEKKNKKLKAEDGQAVPSDAGKKESAPEVKHEKKDKGGEKASEKKGEQKGEKKEKKEKKDESVEEKKSKPVEKELSGGIKVLDSTVGTGSTAKKGNTVSMRYIGKLQNGKIFDKNVKGKPFTFRLGQGEVIKGWDVGIVGMQVGGERKLTIPPNMGYGKKGTDGIPPNSTLIFEVKLVEIK